MFEEAAFINLSVFFGQRFSVEGCPQCPGLDSMLLDYIISLPFLHAGHRIWTMCSAALVLFAWLSQLHKQGTESQFSIHSKWSPEMDFISINYNEDVTMLL